MLGGRQVTRFKRDGEQYDVIVQVDDVDRTDAGRPIATSIVRGRDGEMVPAVQPGRRRRDAWRRKELNHFNQLRAATITATLAPGYSLGEALDVHGRRPRKLLPPGDRRPTSTASRASSAASSSELYFIFVLALLFIYLVLAAQFESFVDPFIIMLTVPLSMTGALLALKLTGGTLNIYSQIGLVTLVGLITKHGILIVEFANQLQRAGPEHASTRWSRRRRCACGRS